VQEERDYLKFRCFIVKHLPRASSEGIPLGPMGEVLRRENLFLWFSAFVAKSTQIQHLKIARNKILRLLCRIHSSQMVSVKNFRGLVL
jgi:hypothetical protein